MRELRNWHDQNTEAILQEFADLNRIEGIHRTQVIRDELPQVIEPDSFSELLRRKYVCPDLNIPLSPQAIENIPAFSMTELMKAIERIANRRGSDKSGIVVEMIKYGGATLHANTLLLYNNLTILETRKNTSLIT